MEKQRALLIIKPDAIQRGLSGEILHRFERVGLKVIGLKFEWAKEQQVRDHYPNSDKWFEKVGNRTLTNYKEKGINAKDVLGTQDPVAIGKLVKEWLVAYMMESPVLLVVVEGYNAIEIVRKLCGDTMPIKALPGTIRGDYSHDSVDLANENARPIRNIIHATDEVEEATKEIYTWFDESEIHDYTRADEDIMF